MKSETYIRKNSNQYTFNNYDRVKKKTVNLCGYLRKKV